MVPRLPVAGLWPAILVLTCALAAAQPSADPISFTHVSHTLDPRALSLPARDLRAVPLSAAELRARNAFPLAASAADGTWEEFNLLQVYGPLAVYDAAHERLLSIGGSRLSNWALPLSGPRAWQPLPAQSSPEYVDAWTSALDPSTGLVYYIAVSEGALEIHTLDPASGTVAAVPGSGIPFGPVPGGLIFDPARHRLLAYGWSDLESGAAEVWALDLMPTPAWSHLEPSGTPPPAFIGFFPIPAVLDPVRHRMVFPTSIRTDYGNGPLTIWALTLDGPAEWLHFETNGLPDGTGYGENPVVYDSPGNRFVTLGGQGELFVLSPEDFHWSTSSTHASGPSPRTGAGIAIDGIGHRLLVCGGATPSRDDTHSDAWALSLDQAQAWKRLSADATRAPIRGGASDGYDASRRRMVVFGGSNELGGFRNDTWVVDLRSAPEWSPLTTRGTPPSGRYWHASAWDPVRDQLVVYGGYYGDPYHGEGDLWTLSFARGTPSWSPITPAGPAPVGRFLSQLVYDSTRDRFLLIFGYDGAPLGDVWELRLSPAPAWRQLTPGGVSPAVRAAEMCVYDALRDRILVFGGGNASGNLNDLWALNLGDGGDGSWQLLAVPTGPSERNLGLLRLDAARDRLVLFGGFGVSRHDGNNTFIDYLNDTWALDLAGTPSWRQLSPEGFLPSGRDRANGAYDPIHDRLVLACGGISGSNDLWALDFTDPPGSLRLAWQWVDSEGVVLGWEPAPRGLLVAVYRREAGAQWQSLGSESEAGDGSIRFEDRDVTPGTTYEYRLGVGSGANEQFFGFVTVQVPVRALALSASAEDGRIRFTVQLPGWDDATVSLFDIAGRQLWSAPAGYLGPGTHSLGIGGRTVSPGIYLALLRQGQETRRARVAVVR